MSDIRVAFVMATWHDDLVDRTRLGFFERMAELGHGEDCIEVHKLPGALEFPLHCKMLAQTGRYDVIVAAALVVDGGIYRHDFVAHAVLQGMMNVMLETEAYGFDRVRDEQQELGDRVRAVLSQRGIESVAAEGFGAPGVVVCYTADPDVKSGAKFASAGVQIAGGVPLQCDEGEDFSTFRLGLFGLDKLHHVDRTVASLEAALDRVF